MNQHVTTPIGDESSKNPEPVKTWLLVFSVLLTAATIAIYFFISSMAKSSGDLFQGFGADLPFLTSFLIDYGRYLVVLAIAASISLILFFRERKSDSLDANRYFSWIVWCFGLSFALCVLSMVAIYMPIFKLGVAV